MAPLSGGIVARIPYLLVITLHFDNNPEFIQCLIGCCAVSQDKYAIDRFAQVNDGCIPARITCLEGCTQIERRPVEAPSPVG
jgi:hypothetical protein